MSLSERSSPWHEGERAVQERVGAREMAERVGVHVIRPAMPEQHQELFAALPYFVVGALAPDGAPVASLLTGAPGFVEAIDAQTLAFRARPVPGDPIVEGLVAGAPVGLLGIQLETRRRNRANGTILAAGADGFVVDVTQSFGNCPQYIQARGVLAAIDRAPGPVTDEVARLSGRALEVVRGADTTFIASAARAADTDGVDVSHRGGKPGFVRADDAGDHTVLTMPDFSGNNFFMTLGNLVENPRAGLLFVDFEHGALLSLTGTTEIVWDGPVVEAFAGAERVIRFHVARGRLLEGAVPFRWTAPDFARQLGRTGAWPEV